MSVRYESDYTHNRFPSPTGATYYEYEWDVIITDEVHRVFPSPTGATYYELTIPIYDESGQLMGIVSVPNRGY